MGRSQEQGCVVRVPLHLARTHELWARRTEVPCCLPPDPCTPQILLTTEAWAAANAPGAAAGMLAAHHITAEPLGPTKLKGSMEKVDLLQARWVQ